MSALIPAVRSFLSSALRSPLVWALILVLLVRALALATYPPNIAGDNVGYFKMLALGKSNLVHPPGYPFLVGLPLRTVLRLTRTAWWIDLHPVRVQYLAIAWQHSLSFAALAVAGLTLRRVFGGGVAALAILLIGLRPRTVGAVGWFFPEWFQADMLMLTLCAAWYAWKSRTLLRKAACYVLAFQLLAACYLTKYNALFLAPALGAVLLSDRFGAPGWRGGWCRRCVAAGLSGALAVGSVAVFARTWHRASTGTAALSRDHAWVLLTALGQWSPGRTLALEAGPETKRLHYLNSVLPWHAGAGPFWHIETTDEGPALREPWRAKYLRVLTLEGPELDALAAGVPAPRAPYDFFTAFFPSYLYLGADESDRLGTRVFVENVRAFPARFLGYYFRQLGRTLWRWPSRPAFDAVPAAPAYAPAGRWGLWRREQASPLSAHTFWYARPLVWRPGARVLHALDRLYALPTPALAAAIAAYLLVQVGRLRHGRLDAAGGAALVLGGFAVSYMAAMHAVFFRYKEAHLVLPLAMVLFAAAMAAVWRGLRGGLRRPAMFPCAHFPRRTTHI